MIARRQGGFALLLLALGLAACDDGAGPPSEILPATEFITARRAWAPGERDSVIARIQRTRQLAFPGIGDVSDYIPFLLDQDSAVDLVPSPAPSPSLRSPFGPSYALGSTMVPGTGWTSAGIDVRIINTSQTPRDTLDWLGWFWWNNADSTAKGFVFMAQAATTGGPTTVNTVAYDASFAKTGAGGGELQGNSFFQANGWVRRNTVRVSTNIALGGTTTVTTGPFLGGTSQTAIMSGQLDSVRMDRQFGTQTPNPRYASVTFNLIGSLRLTCVFPTPCTSNVLREAMLRRRSIVP